MPTTIPTITSSTRPGSPSAGDAYFETDTKNYIIYDGANWYVYNYDETTAFSNTLSLNFDGGDDFLETDYTPSAGFTFSGSVWVKTSNTSSSMAFFSMENSSAVYGITLKSLG